MADVISQVRDGLNEAIEQHNKGGALGRINPVFLNEDGTYDWKSNVVNIEFDIPVTMSDKTLKEGGGGVQVYVAKADTKASRAQEASTTNKIRFSIPVSLPARDVSSQILVNKIEK